MGRAAQGVRRAQGRRERHQEDILQFAKEKLAGFKRPASVEFMELPKTSTGKLQKHLLRKREWGRAATATLASAQSAADVHNSEPGSQLSEDVTESGDLWKAQIEMLGALLRAQRIAADLSLRELSRADELSNAILSQLERVSTSRR